MAQGILTSDFRPEYSENLLPVKSLFNENIAVNLTSGIASFAFSDEYNFTSGKSLYCFMESYKTTDIAFNLGNELLTTIKNQGNHIFSFRMLNANTTFEFFPSFVIYVKVWVNGINTNDFECHMVSDVDTYSKKWATFAQSMSFNETDEVNFSFYIDADLSYPFNNLGFYIDGLKLEYDDRFLGTPSIYSKPILNASTIPSEFIFVSSLSDLPTPVTSVINLLDNYTYYITSEIDLLGNRLVGGENTTILGASSENSILKSTGLGVGVPLISSIYTTPIRNICIKDVDTALSFDGTSNPNDMALDWNGVNFVNVPNVGTIKKPSNFIFDKGSLINSKGLKFDGTIGTVALNNSLFSGDGAAGDIIKLLSTCTITRRFRIIYSSIIAFGSTIGVNVDVSASVPSESYILDTINFSGGGTYLGGVSVTDNKTNFLNCKGIINSKEVSLYYMHSNATTTVISSTNTPVKALGTTTSSAITQKFTNTNNRATYVGSITRIFKVTACASCTSGNNNIVGFYIAKNGVVSTDSEIYTTTSGTGKSENVSIQTLISLSENDYIEIWVENNSSTTNVLVSDLNVIIE